MNQSIGQFINEGRAYRVHSPFPPRQYINVFTSLDGYLAEISHYGTGTATFQFSDGEINTIVDQDKKTIYCRNEETGRVWCPGVYPMMSEVESFTCEHHDAFVLVSSIFDGVKITWRNFIPCRGAMEYWTVAVENLTQQTKKISVVPAVKLLLTGFTAPRFFNEQLQYSICDFREELNGMYFDARNPNPVHKRYNAVLLASQPVNDYSGDIESFLGAPQIYSYPYALIKEGRLGKKKGIAGEPFESLSCMLEIFPGEKEVVDFVFGIVEDATEALLLAEDIREHSKVERLFVDTCNEIKKRREQLYIHTPDDKINAFVNIWLKKVWNMHL